uniref:Uncharacterized protein n=1 Tax=Chenopodium quinoa TaxID=63459 RepID=A0A803LC19_CHEQI
MGGVFSSRSSGRFSTRGRFSTTPAPHYGVYRRPRWRVENKLKELGWYLPLYKAALRGRWKDARKIIDEDPEALTAKISIASETALHIAVGTGTDIPFVEKLVKNMSPEELALTDQNGETALSVAAIVGNLEAAKLLDMEPSPFSGEYGAKLLIYLIHAEFYGLALKLFELNPNLATMELNEVGSPLSVLAEKPNAFPSGSDFKFWPQALNPFSYWNYVRNTKMRHHQAIKLVKCFCEEIMELDDAKAFSMLQEPLHLAAKLGIHEIIEEIVVTFPPAI